MINVLLNRNNGLTTGFTVKNHGATHVCSAVSMLVINTINSIASLTSLKDKEDFKCKYNENGGFIEFSLIIKTSRDKGAGLLLDAMVLGLTSVQEQHPNEISIITKGE